MKNLFKFIIVLTIVSCQPLSSEKESNDTPYVSEDQEPSMYAVSLATAKDDIDYYNKVTKDFLKTDPIKSFTIRSVDFVEAIGMPINAMKKAKYTHARIYLALDSTTNEFKLYLTPVEGAKLSKSIAGKDVILDGPYEGTGDGLGDDGQYMLDFSKPCPTTCPTGGE